MWKWNRREIKSEGKKSLRKNYWRIVGVMILVTLLTTGLNFRTPKTEIAGINSGRLYTNSNANRINDWYNSIETAAEGTDEAEVLTFLGDHYTPKKGVLARPDDDDSLIPVITRADYMRYAADGTVSGGMLPKLENAFNAISAGVSRVNITLATAIDGRHGTMIVEE